MSNEGVVIYVDPYAGEGYDMPADFVIVTHEHSDHNQVDLVTLKDDGVILTRREQESPPTSIGGGMICGKHGVLFCLHCQAVV